MVSSFPLPLPRGTDSCLAKAHSMGSRGARCQYPEGGLRSRGRRGDPKHGGPCPLSRSSELQGSAGPPRGCRCRPRTLPGTSGWIPACAGMTPSARDTSLPLPTPTLHHRLARGPSPSCPRTITVLPADHHRLARGPSPSCPRKRESIGGPVGAQQRDHVIPAQAGIHPDLAGRVGLSLASSPRSLSPPPNRGAGIPRPIPACRTSRLEYRRRRGGAVFFMTPSAQDTSLPLPTPTLHHRLARGPSPSCPRKRESIGGPVDAQQRDHVIPAQAGIHPDLAGRVGLSLASVPRSVSPPPNGERESLARFPHVEPRNSNTEQDGAGPSSS